MQDLPYSYRFYDSIFSMVNVRYKVQKADGVVGFHDYRKKCEEEDDEGNGFKIKRSLS